MRPHYWARAAVAFGVAAFFVSQSTPSHSGRTIMSPAKLKSEHFKTYIANLSADEQRIIKFALKEWIFYHKAPPAGRTVKVNGVNKKFDKNETAKHIMSPGPCHKKEDADDHALSSRQFSTSERNSMVNRYGAVSPFLNPVHPTSDPVKVFSDFSAPNAGVADLTFEKADKIPGHGDKCLGVCKYETTKKPNKGEKKKPIKIYFKSDPGDGKTWCYPKDTDGDGWITNNDAKCPPGTRDFYMLMKHEIGHMFSFWHAGSDFSDPGGIVPQYNFENVENGLQHPNATDGAELSTSSQFAEVNDKIYFASPRPGGFGGSDIWYSTWNDTIGAWDTPVNAGPFVNSSFDERDPNLSMGGSALSFASNRPGGAGGFDIWVAAGDTADFDTTFVLGPEVNSTSDDVSPFVGDEGVFFFASNRPGGFGGMDLYFAPAPPDSDTVTVFLPAINAGSINSAAEEVHPFVASATDTSTVIYFASNRGGGFGGFDIYRGEAVFGIWAPDINVGPPVNSAADELDPFPDPGHMKIYFTSTRSGPPQIHSALNVTPHIETFELKEGRGLPGDTVNVVFRVYNTGSVPTTMTPTATNLHGWPITYDSTPRVILAGDLDEVEVGVIIPGSAAIGDSSVVMLDADADGVWVSSDDGLAFVAEPVVSVGPVTPTINTALHDNFPNPFNPTTTIRFDLRHRTRVQIDVFDVAGRKIRELTNQVYATGTNHVVSWNGQNGNGQAVSSGIYFYRMVTGDGFHMTRKMVLLK